MTPIRKPESRLETGAPDAVPATDPAPYGGPVGALHAELTARLTADEYEAWLLPPEPRDATERFVHGLSLCAGVLALTAVASALWLLF